jgi:hypothetical protein
VSEINGPITIVTGKKRRLTFVECPKDLNAMIDLAKVADLVLLTIDASYGFEMVQQANYLGNLRIPERPAGAWISQSNGRADSSGQI